MVEELDLEMKFYEEGIMRVIIDDSTSRESKGKKKRFKISSYDMGAVIQEHQLYPVQDLKDLVYWQDDNLIISFQSDSDSFKHVLKFSPFRIESWTNGILTSVVND
jgi:hypothetical protein